MLTNLNMKLIPYYDFKRGTYGYLTHWYLTHWYLTYWHLTYWYLTHWYLTSWYLTHWYLTYWYLTYWYLTYWYRTYWYRTHWYLTHWYLIPYPLTFCLAHISSVTLVADALSFGLIIREVDRVYSTEPVVLAGALLSGSRESSWDCTDTPTESSLHSLRACKYRVINIHQTWHALYVKIYYDLMKGIGNEG